MTQIPSDELLERARKGDRDALGELMEKFREMLKGVARQELSVRLQVRVDPSDAVQATFLEAHRDLNHFRGEEIGQFVAWLQQILHNNILQSVEMHQQAQKRSINRESPLRDSDSNGPGMNNVLDSKQSSPSHIAVRQERAQRLLLAMESLPPDQQKAARLRFLEGLSLDQIAEEMQRSKTAIAGLLKRGMQKLRQEFSEEIAQSIH